MATTATAARPRYSENMHFLADRPTRALILGLALDRAAEAGAGRPKEGEVVRDLIKMALEEVERSMSQRAFRELRAAGEAALVARDNLVKQATEATPLAPLPAEIATA